MIKIIVLGILYKQPMHGYEIYDLLKVSQVDRWSGVLPGSIYYALKTLSAKGLIKIKDIEQTGNRNKAIYEITEKGKDEFYHLLIKGWKDELYSFPKNLYTLLAFIDFLPVQKLKLLIEEQIKKFEKELAFWDAEQHDFTAKKNNYLSKAVIENGRKHLELDLELLKLVMIYLEEGDSHDGEFGEGGHH